MKYVSIILALLVSTASFASQKQSATIINSTQTNIHFEYFICESNDCNGSGGAHSFFTDQSTYFKVNLKPNENVRIQYVEEIDYKNGDPIPNGASGSFTDCKASAGQKLRLVPGLTGRTKGSIFCQVE